MSTIDAQAFPQARPRPVTATHPRDPSAVCDCDTHAELGPISPILVLRVTGEIDILTVPRLRTALTAALEQVPRDLVVDLAGVRFCCARGFAVIAKGALTAQRDGTRYCVSGLSDHLDRIATLLWPVQEFARYGSAAAAVSAIRVEQPGRFA